GGGGGGGGGWGGGGGLGVVLVGGGGGGGRCAVCGWGGGGGGYKGQDFNDDVAFQLGNMAKACVEGQVVNSEESWATDVLVQVIVP
ncbi:hypothetical protein C4813_24440, partial [Salmonella enterica subsp. enterica serovar Rubislaw]|uniref:hypothetical protein n=1 Tax=Salmonella enterica TaxID=28901 RepID=UPI000D6178F5